MEKRTAITSVNRHVGHALLNNQNTSFANENASKAVWWLNVDPDKLKRDLHLLLANDERDYLVWVRIEANTFAVPERSFRKRPDKGAIDLELSTDPSRFLVDVKSGGTGYDFSKHVVHKWDSVAGANSVGP